MFDQECKDAYPECPHCGNADYDYDVYGQGYLCWCNECGAEWEYPTE